MALIDVEIADYLDEVSDQTLKDELEKRGFCIAKKRSKELLPTNGSILDSMKREILNELMQLPLSKLEAILEQNKK